jgi:hypothetical protein
VAAYGVERVASGGHDGGENGLASLARRFGGGVAAKQARITGIANGAASNE